jgi:hypothetical protein
MSLKHLNLGSAEHLPKDWTPETRFINYQYELIEIRSAPLPQEPSAPVGESQPLRGRPLGSRSSTTLPTSTRSRSATAR